MRLGLGEHLDESTVFPSVHAAIETFLRRVAGHAGARPESRETGGLMAARDQATDGGAGKAKREKITIVGDARISLRARVSGEITRVRAAVRYRTGHSFSSSSAPPTSRGCARDFRRGPAALRDGRRRCDAACPVRRVADREAAALSPEAGVRAAFWAAGVGRRPTLRPRLPPAPHRAAGAGSEEDLKPSRAGAPSSTAIGPLWEMWLVEGLERDRFAPLIKVHHCIMDGVAGASLLMTPSAPSPMPRSRRPSHGRPA